MCTCVFQPLPPPLRAVFAQLAFHSIDQSTIPPMSSPPPSIPRCAAQTILVPAPSVLYVEPATSLVTFPIQDAMAATSVLSAAAGDHCRTKPLTPSVFLSLSSVWYHSRPYHTIHVATASDIQGPFGAGIGFTRAPKVVSGWLAVGGLVEIAASGRLPTDGWLCVEVLHSC